MTVFTYELVKRLMDACDELLGNLIDSGDYRPAITSPDDDFPLDSDGNPIFADVLEVEQALAALSAEDTAPDDALLIASDDTVPIDDYVPLGGTYGPMDEPPIVYHPDPE